MPSVLTRSPIFDSASKGSVYVAQGVAGGGDGTIAKFDGSGQPVTSFGTAGKITIAEVEHLVQPGELDGDMIHTPGVYVQRIIQTNAEKRIEVRTLRKRPAAA